MLRRPSHSSKPSTPPDLRLLSWSSTSRSRRISAWWFALQPLSESRRSLLLKAIQKRNLLPLEAKVQRKNKLIGISKNLKTSRTFAKSKKWQFVVLRLLKVPSLFTNSHLEVTRFSFLEMKGRDLTKDRFSFATISFTSLSTRTKLRLWMLQLQAR